MFHKGLKTMSHCAFKGIGFRDSTSFEKQEVIWWCQLALSPWQQNDRTTTCILCPAAVLI